jgi:hypothetical protein
MSKRKNIILGAVVSAILATGYLFSNGEPDKPVITINYGERELSSEPIDTSVDKDIDTNLDADAGEPAYKHGGNRNLTIWRIQ